MTPPVPSRRPASGKTLEGNLEGQMSKAPSETFRLRRGFGHCRLLHLQHWEKLTLAAGSDQIWAFGDH